MGELMKTIIGTEVEYGHEFVRRHTMARRRPTCCTEVLQILQSVSVTQVKDRGSKLTSVLVSFLVKVFDHVPEVVSEFLKTRAKHSQGAARNISADVYGNPENMNSLIGSGTEEDDRNSLIRNLLREFSILIWDLSTELVGNDAIHSSVSSDTG
jgi:hypothetical protein